VILNNIYYKNNKSKMPLPIPKKGEDRKKFTSRCMSSEIMKDDFPDIKQRYAVCMSQLKRKKKKKLHENKYILKFIDFINEYYGINYLIN
jgi:hypothetical protein